MSRSQTGDSQKSVKTTKIHERVRKVAKITKIHEKMDEKSGYFLKNGLSTRGPPPRENSIVAWLRHHFWEPL